MIKICAVIGTRPQFIKHAAIQNAIDSDEEVECFLVDTGQHYDKNMSDIFFDQFGLPVPDVSLNVGSHSHGKQTSLIMLALEPVLDQYQPDYVLVYGDTNSTLAAALVAQKYDTQLIHIEAGLRSNNRAMPEEINRIVTDRISDILFAPSAEAVRRLESEGMGEYTVFSGDVMKDMVKLAINQNKISETQGPDYYYASIHRPYNTDDKLRFGKICQTLDELDKPIVCSLHPRTRTFAIQHDLSLEQFSNIQWLNPIGYFESLNLIYNASAIITDSGGMQKEAYWLKRKCITVRPETEWTETLQNNCNQLVFHELEQLSALLSVQEGDYDEQLYGDGYAAKKILNYLKRSGV